MLYPNEPIAIVGTGCRFPGKANSSWKLWDLLCHPPDLSTAIPASRFNSQGFYHKDGAHHGTSNVQKSYFLEEDVRNFDSQFFNISTAEAESMDPQQRQLLEVVYEAMESANMTLEQMRGTPTAVYVGLMCDDYAGVIFSDMESVPIYGATGAARSILSNRISYFYDWTGPSYTIDSACSSSLVAVHQAVQQLRNGECSVALAAGANFILSPRMFIAESNLKMLSPNGRCHMWDADGDGYARGEGIAAVLLKRLSDAIADGDHIEAVIRETHVNQGGRSTGLTVPNPVAQVNLIRETYRKAGLDLTRPEDRPQYFQAHGTGTKVGDLNEATAIHNTFFKDQGIHEKLYVGSVKTIIGHSEGAAGIAGLLEACLAVKHGVIPPNLHFDKLNPNLEPFYKRLEVPTQPVLWPETGPLRRASVNSFGFGGTNAHAILENYVSVGTPNSSISERIYTLPFVWSAASDRSLGLLLDNYSQFLNAHPDVDLSSLSRTLLDRRSVLTHKISFTAKSTSELRSKLEYEIERRTKGNSRAIVTRPLTRPKSILGIFTGQGAQWASMGWDMISTSPEALSILRSLEKSLASLPVEHRPQWSLEGELSAPASLSRVAEAVISQPLCTAVQIILVDILKRVGVDFSAVVGHSSGEIGAAYSAGFITADTAIKIAYYRGFYSNLAGSGVKGAMLAVGTSMAEANKLCQSLGFKGRICVAASNSSSSVTLSGNADAIYEVKHFYDAESVFARVLKVDTAYHSHHMAACSEAYLQALQACNFELPPRLDDSCLWFSSVDQGKIMVQNDTLKGSYWVDNMLKAVTFFQALTQATEAMGAFDFAIEFGPHPALKGPALQTMSEATGLKKEILYSSLLARGKDGLETFAEALGSMWMQFGSSGFDTTAYAGLFGDKGPRTALTGLPTYPWDHDRPLWYESRASRENRNRPNGPHQLLGVSSPDQAEGEHIWRNYLKLSEIPWLSGHKIQGQVVFPAAGYVIMALEASKSIPADKEVRVVEVQDLQIVQAIVLRDDSSGVETLFGVKNIKTFGDMVTADWTCHACLNRDTGSLVLMSSGRLVLHLGQPAMNTLPERSHAKIHDLRAVDIESFYENLEEVGYGYTGPLRAISKLEQKLDVSTGLIADANFDNEEDEMMVHPASLDAAIQTLFACLGTPGDGSLWTMHVPVVIQNIRINPQACKDLSRKDILFDSSIEGQKPGLLCGDVTLYDPTSQTTIMQIEGIEVKPLTPATATNDRHLFHELVCGVAEPDAEVVYRKIGYIAAEMNKAEILEMVCLYFLQQLDGSIALEERENCSWHAKRILAFASHVVEETKQGKHLTCKASWLGHTWEDVAQLIKPYTEDIGFKLALMVGSKLIPFIKGETTILEHIIQDGLLDSYYQSSELLEYNEYAGKLVDQIAFRYPLMKVLEIGAGTGGATRSILRHLDNKYASYTFTDISLAFFERAQETFWDNGRMIYEVLDVEKDPRSQGFEEGSYDIVIASNVLHATKFLDQTMSNARKLLKPGGKLLVLEAINNGSVRVGFSFQGLPGWFAGDQDGRELSPLITGGQWNELLLRNGFSGIDTIATGSESVHTPAAVFVSTAVDEMMSMLRKPLQYQGVKPDIGTVVILGGQSPQGAILVGTLTGLMKDWSSDFRVLQSLEDLDQLQNISMVHVLNLSDLDSPIFKDITASIFEAFKSLLNASKSFLWVTAGAKSTSPYSSMALGIGRTLILEMPHLHLQVLDTENAAEVTPKLIVEAFLRLVLVESWENDVYAANGRGLWSNEPELWLRDGKICVTRMVAEKEANQRLMSGRRLIEEEVDLGNMVVDVVSTATGFELQKRLEGAEIIVDDASVEIDVEFSTLTAVRLSGDHHMFVIVGTTSKDKVKVIALSRSLGSKVLVSPSLVMPWDISAGQESSVIAAIAYDLLAQSLLNLKSNTTIVLYEPNSSLASAITKRTRFSKAKPCFITIKPGFGAEHWLFVHPFSTDRELRSRLPKDVTTFIDASHDAISSDSLVARIKELLPTNCRTMDASSLFSQSSTIDAGVCAGAIGDSLRIAVANSVSALLSSSAPDVPQTISARDLSSMVPSKTTLQIIDWTSISTLPIRIQSAEKMVRFKADRTYLLIGLSGDLGCSLCRWMILHGAQHIVITSRNPRIEQSWLDEMHDLGGRVRVMAMDVSDRASLQSTYNEIVATLPPIAGVANAAMVLSDNLLSNMSFIELQAVLKPKVDGSRYLDDLFPHNTLDFFILFGSAVDIMGNSGQAAYCAANMFMNSLAHSRRSRGLAGSLIGLGEVKGVGYAARLGKKLNDIIGATLPMSEREVHAMFAEGVLAGAVASGRNPVLYAGMDSKNPAVDPDLMWYPHPKFWHYIESGEVGAVSEKGEAVESVKSQLFLAKTDEDVKNIVLAAFILRLRHKLQIPSSSPVSPDMVLLELGIDSLVAVDIRAWFVTELRVDMPILKILGGSAIIDLVNDAVIRLPGVLLPALERKVEEGALVPNGLGGFVVPVVKEEPIVHGPIQELEYGEVTTTSDSEEMAPPTMQESENGEVTTTSDSEPDTVLLHMGHSKKDSSTSTSLGFSLAFEEVFSESNSPSFSDVSDLSDHDVDGQLQNIVFKIESTCGNSMS